LSGDNSFNPAVARRGSIALPPDGRVLVNTHDGLVRLHADGNLDADFNHGTNWGGAVRTVALQPDGNNLAGGGSRTVG